MLMGATVSNGVEVLKYTAFSRLETGGNPAGVVIEPGDLSDAEMMKRTPPPAPPQQPWVRTCATWAWSSCRPA